MTVYDVLSPDGFSIHPSQFYLTPESAEAAFHKWAERFKAQGYYSSNRGRIDLLDLQDECSLVPRERSEEDLEGFELV
jgi:hypothetical protein